jgi:hypothetical protein
LQFYFRIWSSKWMIGHMLWHIILVCHVTCYQAPFVISYLCVRHWLGRSWDVIYCSFFWRKTLCHLLFVKLEFTMKWTQYKKDKQFFTRKICSSSFSNANLKIYISSFDQIEYSFCQCHWKIELQNLLGQHSFFVSSFCSND